MALVVASTGYTDPAFTQLRSPARDAADMVDVLADPDVGGFTVTPVLDQPEHEIRRAVDAFLAGRGVDDLVVVYLSGHGVLDARGRLYFAAKDTVRDRLSSTAVESAWLLDRLEECRARRQVLILDCCFSGAFAQTKGGAEVDLERRLVGAGRGRAVLTASRAGEYSYEGTPLPGAAVGGSVFTAALVDGLRSGAADRDGDGYISVEDAYAHAADQVRAAGGTQSPQRWLYGAEGEIVLARNPRGAAVTPAVLPEALQLSLDSPYPDIRRAAVATLGTWLTATDPGQVLAAQQALHLVAAHDSPTVATAARDLLRTAEPTPPPTPAPTADRRIDSSGPGPSPEDDAARGAIPRRCLRTIEGHSRWMFAKAKPVNTVAFSPDGRLLASGGDDNMVRLWNPSTGQPVGQPLTGHTGLVYSVAFSPDGHLLASGGKDSKVRLWNPTTGQPVGQPLTGHAGEVNSVAFSPDGDLLASASGGYDKTVRLWNPTTGQPVGQPLTGHTHWVYSVAFSPDGHLLASASLDGTVRLWNPTTGLPIGQPLTGHTGFVYSVAFSPDGHVLASASRDATVRLWNPTTGQPVGQPLTGHTGLVYSVAFSPDGHLLASGGDNTVRLWNPTTGQPIGQPLTGHAGEVNSVAFSPDGDLLASASEDKSIRIWGAA
ncbi:caspase, EACC1-associated type [Dactylosporangium cerinum]